MPWIKNRPLRVIIWWQVLFAIVSALVCGLLVDFHSAMSAMLGGLVSAASSTAFAVMVSRHRGYTASGTLRTALRAEAVKIILAVILLWLVFTTYEAVNMLAFIATFVVAVIINSMALLVSVAPEIK